MRWTEGWIDLQIDRYGLPWPHMKYSKFHQISLLWHPNCFRQFSLCTKALGRSRSASCWFAWAVEVESLCQQNLDGLHLHKMAVKWRVSRNQCLAIVSSFSYSKGAGQAWNPYFQTFTAVDLCLCQRTKKEWCTRAASLVTRKLVPLCPEALKIARALAGAQKGT